MENHGHIPVLVAEVLDLLDPRPGETALDATVGRGGHAAALAGRLGPSGTLVGLDLDPGNVPYVLSRLRGQADSPRLVIRHASFARAPQVLRELGLAADLILSDLGFSSNQMDDPSRGFSFREPGPLDMRFDRTRGEPASALLARLSEREIADLIFQLGEDPFAPRIARKLVEYQRTRTIEDTATLARLVREAYGSRARASRIDPATRTFMALRIAVNDELGALRTLLDAISRDITQADSDERAPRWINPQARIGIISFHSLEDRLVKHSFRELVRAGAGEAVTRKPITASPAETEANPRSRSAKLRVIRAR